MQFPLNHKHAITSDNRFFVIGGTFNLTSAYKETYEIVDENNFVDRKPLLSPRHSFGCIPINTSIIVIGGYYSITKTLSSCEIYNSLRDEWLELPYLSASRA